MRTTAIEGAVPAGPQAGPAMVRVWDPFVRIFHWTVVGCCAADLFVLGGGRLPHTVVGYTVAALVAARVVWGFIGPRHARFAGFVPGPAALLRYLSALARGREPRLLGHNPAGAVMILALLATLAGLGVTGWMTTLDAFWGAEWLENLHGTLADGLLALVAVHAAAAVIEGARHRENLVWAMVTGRKRASSPAG